MKPTRFRLWLPYPLLALLLFWQATAPLLAWDAGAHMLVAEIAWRHLTPEARAKAERLPPLLDRRARRDGRPYHFVSAGPWMDELKSFPKEYPWNRLHYVNLECDEPFPATPPRGEHAASALQAAAATLRNRHATEQAQSIALGQLIHLVADIHQPLHAASRRDRGGNGYLIVPPVPPPARRRFTRPYSLHQFWDNAYRFDKDRGAILEIVEQRAISRRPRHPSDPGCEVTHLASRLLKQYPKADFPELSPERPEAFWQWTRESHELALRHGWPPGPAPQTHEVGRLTPDFVSNARPIAERRIVLAGYRLAVLLNALLKEEN